MMKKEFIIHKGILREYRGNGGAVVIPDTVTEIGKSVFSGCKTLTRVTIPNSVKTINSLAFYECTNLEEVVIPDSVTHIYHAAFASCTALSSVTLSGSITVLESVFNNCIALKSIVIPDSVTEISTLAFAGCISLEEVTLPENLKYVGYCAFNGCESLNHINLPDSVKGIGKYAFAHCNSLSDLIIPQAYSVIETGAFAGIESVWLPERIDKSINNLLRTETSAVQCIYTTAENFEYLDSTLKNSAIVGFLRLWEQGKLTDSEHKAFTTLLKKRLTRTFSDMKDHLPLYRFATNARMITRKNADKLLEQSESIECRMLLLEYRRTL